MDYFPDKAVLLKIVQPHQTTYKIFATFFGGFTYGDSWKLNSGITRVEKKDDGSFLCHGYSGSAYRVHPNNEGTSGYTQGVLNKLISDALLYAPVVSFEILPLSDLETLNDVLQYENGNSSTAPQETTP